MSLASSSSTALTRSRFSPPAGAAVRPFRDFERAGFAFFAVPFRGFSARRGAARDARRSAARDRHGVDVAQQVEDDRAAVRRHVHVHRRPLRGLVRDDLGGAEGGVDGPGWTFLIGRLHRVNALADLGGPPIELELTNTRIDSQAR